MAMTIFFVIPAASAKDLFLATDITPGGHFIVGGGTAFNPEKPGLEIELYRMVARQLGLQLRIERIPWKLCLQKLESNQVDGIFPASYKKERTEIGHYPMKDGSVDTTRKTRDNAYYLYTLKNSKLTWDGEEFSGLSGIIGVPAGWAIVEDLKKKGVAVKEITVHPQTPDLLVLGRLQGFVCLETVFDSYLSDAPEKYADIAKISPPIWEKPYYLMLSKQFVESRPETAEEFWNAIGEVRGTEAFRILTMSYIDYAR